ncbi:hypothetical protein B5807_05756 [Epicoccum nigrum]|uniref:Lipoyl-binding domain-containing protein n=1 Tax=Epicoccum nigrum TaxID=105696 RepID=A0A1Y2LYS4_EPING|nr:hypothetical protein B5807_05756 [Epicoccum nigrum]
MGWEISAMVGPHDEGYFAPDIEMVYETKWKVSHNASRSGIRLTGPVPKWARKDGGEGGAHPSNLVEYGYPIGTLNWTGNDPCIFPIDCPNFGGFTSSTTVVKADWWKIGQLKAGNTLKFIRISLEDALKKKKRNDDFLDLIEEALKSKSEFDKIDNLQAGHVDFHQGQIGKAVIWEKAATANTPQVRYRQGGDDHLLVEYGNESFDLNHWCRVTALENALKSSNTPMNISRNLLNTVGCCTTLLIYYNGAKLPRSQLVLHLQKLEEKFGDLQSTKVPTRVFKLPISFESKLQDEAPQRYMTNQRPHAPYLPDNLSFVAKNNALTAQQFKDIYLIGQFMAVVVGFFYGNTVSLPVDPRQRMSAPKMNLSRVFTPEVSEEELDSLLGQFRAGKFTFEYEDVEFDMADHNRLLQDTVEEVKKIRAHQARLDNQIDGSTVERLLDDPDITPIEAPADANVWKVEVKEGDTILILEAMKLEIAVKTPDTAVAGGAKLKVQKLLVKPGDTVTAGGHLALLKKE